jgi:3-oxoacyl-[acyl-carrier-protein] synthase-1
MTEGFFLNDLGIANPLGCGKEVVAGTLFKGTRNGLVERDDLIPGRSVRVGEVRDALPAVPDRLRRFDCRNNRIALLVLQQIEAVVSRAARRYGADRIAVVMGTSTSGIADGERALAHRLERGEWPSEFRYSQQEIGNLADFTAAYLGLSGPAYTVATACSSSAKVFGSARRLIEAGFCDAALVGGVDTLCRLTMNGFASLEAIAKSYCNPFSRNRDGINIGEGAAVFLMTREPAPVALLGVGESSDAHHISAPDPAGIGARRAMGAALRAAELQADSIDYVNLHGTATRLNDLVEGRVVAELFGIDVPCSSTKAMTGHMLGAAGAGEAAFLWLTLHLDYSAGVLPPHLWDGEADPEIPPLDLVQPGRTLPCGTRSAMLSNSFGFGGSNAAVVLGRGW